MSFVCSKCGTDDCDDCKSKPDFGDYVRIEQKRHGAPNEMFLYKVIGRMHSNTWVETPVQSPATESHHGIMAEVISCICCGVEEVNVRKFRLADIKLLD